jgi:hypothetical protein
MIRVSKITGAVQLGASWVRWVTPSYRLLYVAGQLGLGWA